MQDSDEESVRDVSFSNWARQRGFEISRQPGLAVLRGSENGNDRPLLLMDLNSALSNYPKVFGGNRDILLAAGRYRAGSLFFASEDLRSDREFIMAAVKQDDEALEYASPNLRNDREIVLAAVKQNGYALGYASEALKNDREIVLEAVKQAGGALEYASPNLRNDREIALAALKNDFNEAVEYVPEALMNDRDFVLAALKEGLYELLYSASSELLRNDREIVLAAVRWCGSFLEDASADLRSDREIVLTSLELHIYNLEYASEDLKNDPNFVASAIADSDNPRGWPRYIGKTLQEHVRSAFQGLQDRVKANDIRIGFDNTVDILRYARRWEREIYERLWLVLQQAPAEPLLPETRQRILQYTAPLLAEEFRQVRTLVDCAPLILADANLEEPQISRWLADLEDSDL